MIIDGEVFFVEPYMTHGGKIDILKPHCSSPRFEFLVYFIEMLKWSVSDKKTDTYFTANCLLVAIANRVTSENIICVVSVSS